MNEKNSLEIRKSQIKIAVDEYYKRTHNNYSDSLEELTARALDLYLNSNITIRDICLNITKGDLLKKEEKVIEKNPASEIVEENDSFHSQNSENVSADSIVINNPIVSTNPVVNDINNDLKEYEVPASNLDNVTHKSHNSRIETLLLNLVSILNHEKIDYQLSDDWATFIKNNNENKLDLSCIVIHLNEKDISRFKKACSSLGLEFKDNRMDSSKVLLNGKITGESEVKALSSDEEKVIQAVCFERLLDGTIINKDYYHDENGLACCREEIIGSNLAKEAYGREDCNFQGQIIPVVSSEFEYLNNNKSDTLTPYLDKVKLDKVRELIKSEIFIQFVPVNTLPPTSMINTQSLENDNSELSQMLTDTNINKDVDKDKIVNKDNKQKVKELKNQNGNIDGYTVVASILVIIALVLVGLIGFTYFQG